MVKLVEISNKPFECREIGRLEETLEELLKSLSRKFWAKLKRIAEEFNVTPAEVVNEGIELYRKRHRLLNGPLAQQIADPERIEHYSAMQSLAGKLTAQRMGEEAVKKRALAGAKGRVASLKRKKKAAEKAPHSTGDGD
jgi:hypothetical protein